MASVAHRPDRPGPGSRSRSCAGDLVSQATLRDRAAAQGERAGLLVQRGRRSVAPRVRRRRRTIDWRTRARPRGPRIAVGPRGRTRSSASHWGAGPRSRGGPCAAQDPAGRSLAEGVPSSTGRRPGSRSRTEGRPPVHDPIGVRTAPVASSRRSRRRECARTGPTRRSQFRGRAPSVHLLCPPRRPSMAEPSVTCRP